MLTSNENTANASIMEETGTSFFKDRGSIHHTEKQFKGFVNHGHMDALEDKQNQRDLPPLKYNKNKSISKKQSVNASCLEQKDEAKHTGQKKCKPIRSKKLIDLVPVKYVSKSRDFVLKPIQQGKILCANVARNPSCFSNHMQIFTKQNTSEIMVARKEKNLLTTKIHLSMPAAHRLQSQSDSDNLSEKNGQPELGYILGNFTGSLFNVYEGDAASSQLVATIVYGSPEKVWGNRQVQIYCMDKRFNTYLDPQFRKLDNLKEVYEKSRSQAVLKFKNKKPKYSQQKDMYFLNINGEQPGKSSVHNIVFKDEENNSVFKFYKTEDRNYQLEVHSSISLLIAYSFVLTSFNFKWVSQ